MPDAPAPDRGFEDVLKELTQVVERLERGNLPLDESIALYARGTELLKAAQGVLDSAQARLDVLTALPGGHVKSEPLDPAEFLKDT